MPKSALYQNWYLSSFTRATIKFGILAVCLLLTPIAHAASTSSMGAWYGQLNLGIGGIHSGKNQELRLTNTPMPGRTNGYSTTNKAQGQILLGLGGGYAFHLTPRFNLGLGLEADLLSEQTLSGIVHPFVNVAPSSDPLNYQFSAKSYLLLAQISFKYQLTSHWGAFITPLAGLSWNRLSGYNETVPTGSLSIPVTPFSDSTTTDFAYGLGLGVSFTPDVLNNKSVALLLGYRYINAGSASLGASSQQTTGDRLSTGPLRTNMLYLSLEF